MREQLNFFNFFLGLEEVPEIFTKFIFPKITQLRWKYIKIKSSILLMPSHVNLYTTLRELNLLENSKCCNFRGIRNLEDKTRRTCCCNSDSPTASTFALIPDVIYYVSTFRPLNSSIKKIFVLTNDIRWLPGTFYF